MTQYCKVKLYGSANGDFKANAILVKRVSDTLDNVCRWYLVYRHADNLAVSGADNAGTFHFGELSVTCGGPGGLNSAPVYTGRSQDSFETLLINERLRTDSILRPWRVVLGDEVFGDNSGVFSVDFDDLFIVEARETASVSGILIKGAYTQNISYTGFGSYHHHAERNHFNTPISNDKPYRIGVELEVYARNRQAREKIIGARTNWFQCEADGSLSESINGVSGLGIEMKTIPLRPCDATSVDFWNEPMAKLAELAVSKGHSTTGLHVHISKEILGASEAERQKNLNKLITFYTFFIEDNPAAKEKNRIICGRSQGYGVCENGAKPLNLDKIVGILGVDAFVKNEAAFNCLADMTKQTAESQRGDINLHCWNSYGTIEFRRGDGRISRTRLAAICTWWEQMCLYVKETQPSNLSFDDFFSKVCRDYPSVAYFFQTDEEC